MNSLLSISHLRMIPNLGTCAAAALTICTCSAYVDYTPSAFVKAAHNIPHFNMYFQRMSSTFGITPTSLNTSNTYLLSVVSFPALILAIGILGLIILGLIMTTRCCCKCGKNAPNVNKMDGKSAEEYSAWVKEVVCRKVTILVFFCLFLILAFSGSQIAWYGSSKFNSGISGLRTDLSSLAIIFQGLGDRGQSFSTSGIALGNQLSQSACAISQPAAISTIQGYVSNLKSTGDSITSDTSSIYSNFLSIDNYLSLYGVHYRSLIFHISYSVVSGFCLLIGLGAILQNKVLSQIMWFFTYWLVLISAIVSTVLMVPVMVLSDFCIDPSVSLYSALSSSGTVGTYAVYYKTCSGFNPLNSSFVEASTATNQLNESISALLKSNCQQDTNLITALTYLPGIKSTIKSTEDLVSCPSIQLILNNSINNSTCIRIFDGIWIYFLCIICTSFSLYIVLCTSSVMWSYYHPFFWKLDPSSQTLDPDISDLEDGEAEINKMEIGEKVKKNKNSKVKTYESKIGNENGNDNDNLNLNSIGFEGKDGDKDKDDKSYDSSSTDTIPMASPPVSSLLPKPSIFELLIANENEQKIAKKLEMIENSKKRNSFLSRGPAPSAPELTELDLQGSNF